MARKPRIHYPGAFYHVMLRGNSGNPIFYGEKDYQEFEKLLAEGIERFCHRILAFCWMTNHIHLLIQVDQEPLSTIIQNLSFRYTRYFNKKNSQIGHLFQGRYRALLVDADNYLLSVARYIHLNPIEARLEKKLGTYPWSSHLAYIDRKKLDWLDVDYILSLFAKTKSTALKRYMSFMEDSQKGSTSVFGEVNNQDSRILGNDNFAEKAYKKSHKPFKLPRSMDEIIKAVCQNKEYSQKKLLIPSRKQEYLFVRNIIAYLGVKHSRENLQAIASKLNVNASTLSRARHVLLERLDSDKELEYTIETIEDTLNV